MNGNKELKLVVKKVDAIIQAIQQTIPSDFTPFQVKAIFDLYISLYE